MADAVKSADRVLRTFELLTDHPSGLTLTEICNELELPKSSAHSLLTTMESRGFLTQDPLSRRYRIGIRLWQAAQGYLIVGDIDQSARPFMEALRDEFNETVQLAVLDGADNVYIGKVDPDQQLRLESRVGVRLPAHATGIGKALLSGLTEAELRQRFRKIRFLQYTPTSITSLEQLISIVRLVRENGYATDDSEYTPGVYCVAAPIYGPDGSIQAAISLSLPEIRKSASMLQGITPAVLRQARAISARLGHHSG
jgi:IclR family transcriptional regulator, KDG regulon repressor